MLSTANLGYLAIEEPVLYDWLNSLTGAFNALQQQVGVDAAPSVQTDPSQALPTPKPPASIIVTTSGGVSNIKIGASPGATTGVQYFLEVSTGAEFGVETTTVYPLGNTLSLALSLGNGNFYFRGRCKYPSSDYSAYTYWGSAAMPSGVVGGGFVGGATLKTAHYSVLAADDGLLLVANSTSSISFALPSTPPSTSWKVFVANIGIGALTLSAGGSTVDGQPSLTFGQYQGAYVATDGAEYFTLRG